MPVSAISSVRGIGVADIVRTSAVRKALQPLLVLHAEALLLVDDHQPQLGKAHVFREQPVRADHDVDGALLHVLEDPLLLGSRHEAREHRHLHRERRVALAERDEVLLGEQRRRTAATSPHHGLEGGSHRDLGLAGPTSQIGRSIGRGPQSADLLDGRDLVNLVRERVLELHLPRRVGAERVPLDRHAHRVQADELAGHVPHRTLHAARRARPVVRAEA
jgi:hypothetical protein